jgi:site-specific recombinase XerC
LSVFTEIKNRGVQDVCIAVCDGLKGLPEAITATWELATVQACVIHLIGNTFRFASGRYWQEMSRDLRPVYTAPSETVARERFAEFDARWGKQYPAISKLWENAWSEFIPFLDYNVEIRRVICSTNAIESLNARYRRAVRARGQAPSTRHTFRVALDRFVRYSREEKGLRGSTLHEYERIGERLAERPWRSGSMWADRVLDTFSEDDLLAIRRELVAIGRSADTLNHNRRVIRGIFGTHPTSPVLAWEWMAPKIESEGKLRFYTPEQVERLIAEASTIDDEAIYTVATEEGARMSEIRALKVSDVDFAVGVVRLEDGYTTYGGFAGNKGRRTPIGAGERKRAAGALAALRRQGRGRTGLSASL